jgi:UDP-N-acetyl-D-mannosaminuronate dehydrogenase
MSDIAVIIGLGYVGLPLAREATRSGLRVIGRNTTKVIGGHTENWTEAAADFYGKFAGRENQGTREAEMAKLLENTYRHINIALVNEMARFWRRWSGRFVNEMELLADRAKRHAPTRVMNV